MELVKSPNTGVSKWELAFLKASFLPHDGVYTKAQPILVNIFIVYFSNIWMFLAYIFRKTSNQVLWSQKLLLVIYGLFDLLERLIKVIKKICKVFHTSSIVLHLFANLTGEVGWGSGESKESKRKTLFLNQWHPDLSLQAIRNSSPISYIEACVRYLHVESLVLPVWL